MARAYCKERKDIFDFPKGRKPIAVTDLLTALL